MARHCTAVPVRLVMTLGGSVLAWRWPDILRRHFVARQCALGRWVLLRLSCSCKPTCATSPLACLGSLGLGPVVYPFSLVSSLRYVRGCAGGILGGW